MAWGALGDTEFAVLGGPFEFQDKQEMDWAEHALVGSKPRLQLVGAKLEEISLRLRLHQRTSSSPELDLRALLDSMRQGTPQALVVGMKDSGIYAGQFVIMSVEHDRQEQWPNGQIRMAEVTVKLKEWVEAPRLVLSSRKVPPAVKKKGKSSPPSVQTQVKTETVKGFSIGTDVEPKGK